MRWLFTVAGQLTFPADLIWESPNLASIVLLQQGANIYAPATYASEPFVLTMYTPLYHAVVALFPIGEENPFFYGRLVATVCMAGVALLLGAAGTVTRSWALRAFVAATFLTLWPVSTNSAFVKSDPLALVLAVGAVVLGASRSTTRTALACGALAILALSAKQSYVAASIVLGATFLLRSPRLGVTFAAALLGLGGTLAGLATWSLGGGFWFSTVHAVRQPFSLETGARVVKLALGQPLASTLLLIAGGLAFTTLRRVGLRRWIADRPAHLYFSLAMLQALASLWKVGASTNYFLEPFAAALLVVLTSSAVAEREAPLRARWPVWVLLAAATLDLVVADRADYGFATEEALAERSARREVMEEARAMLGVSDPKVLNLQSHRDMFSLSKSPFFNDALLYRTLVDASLLSPEPLVGAVERRSIDVVVVPAGYLEPGPRRFALDANLREALVAHYRVAFDVPAYRLRFLVPVGSSPAAPPAP